MEKAAESTQKQRWWDRYHVQAEIAFAVVGLLMLALIVDPMVFVAVLVFGGILFAIVQLLRSQPPPARTSVDLPAIGSDGLMRPHWDSDVLGPLTHMPFRSLCADYFAAKGYHTKFMPETSSTNVDIYLFRDSKAPRPLGVIQCQPGIRSEVDVPRLQQLVKVMKGERIPLGICVSAGTFTDEARQFSQRHRLKLMTGEELSDLLRELAPSSQAAIFQRAHEELQSIPVCPRCGSSMHRMDLVSRGKHHYWGCNNYPDCRQTLETG